MDSNMIMFTMIGIIVFCYIVSLIDLMLNYFADLLIDKMAGHMKTSMDKYNIIFYILLLAYWLPFIAFVYISRSEIWNNICSIIEK